MAVRRDTIKRLVGLELYQVMEPGDQVIAGTWAMAGPGPWLEVVSGAAVIALGVVGVARIAPGARPEFFWPLVPSLLPLVTMFMRRPVFVAVTQRQLICYRLSRMNNKPVRLMFCAPLPAVRATPLRPPALQGGRSIRYDGPGAEGRSLRLNVSWPWRRDLDEVLAALHAQGASVAPPRSQRTNSLARGALIWGLLGFPFFPAAIVAIIFGHIARRETRQTGESGRGLATAGLILGYAFITMFLVVVVVLVLTYTPLRAAPSAT